MGEVWRGARLVPPSKLKNKNRRRALPAQVLIEPSEDFLPAVEGGVLAVLGAIDGKEGVTGVLVHVELVRLPELLERRLRRLDVVRRGARVLDAEEAEQRTREVPGELDGGDRLARRQLLRLGHHTATVAVDRRVDALQRAGRQVGLAPARTVADYSHLAVEVGQAPEVVDG